MNSFIHGVMGVEAAGQRIFASAASPSASRIEPSKKDSASCLVVQIERSYIRTHTESNSLVSVNLVYTHPPTHTTHHQELLYHLQST